LEIDFCFELLNKLVAKNTIIYDVETKSVGLGYFVNAWVMGFDAIPIYGNILGK